MTEATPLAALKARVPQLWLNPDAARPGGAALEAVRQQHGLGLADIVAADELLRRWGPVLARLFPELEPAGGIIDSALVPLDGDDAAAVAGARVPGRCFIKADHDLPVAGSIKARGGIFEVLHHAESLAARAGLYRPGDDPAALLQPGARECFAAHTVAVGSTGNLGLSIGVMASALGFRAVVHMSSDAKGWKKQRLRDRGVTVVEHRGDYAQAVATGREQARQDPAIYFVDDENSRHLFLGYAVAALRLRAQLQAAGVPVDPANPLFFYLPCGVGGAPGGITFGMKHVFGDAAHCFFAEPTASAAMLVRALSGDRPCSVYDVGLDNVTEADGLAVGEVSELVYQLTRRLFAGVYTVSDDDLFRVLYRLKARTGIQIEPSAAAAFLGWRYFEAGAGKRYLEQAAADPGRVGHIFWTTGGSFVPQGEYDGFYRRGGLLAGR